MSTSSAPFHGSLADWLAYQDRLHSKPIELGLDRVKNVAQNLDLLKDVPVTLTVAGTNGKGSSATLAALIYLTAGYRTGLYTSPHLLRYNERVAINGEPVSDEALCRAFTAIEQSRGDTPLTYFEFGTLAALWLFREAQVQVQVLEVGLGGRLDAVNIVDADCALITHIGLDHTDWLGTTREAIGFEKAGIVRRGKPAVLVDPHPPISIARQARLIGTPLQRLGHEFNFVVAADKSWNTQALKSLPAPGLSGAIQYRNAAGVLAAVRQLDPQLPVTEQTIRSALPRLRLRGRFERIGRVILDVAHNAEAAAELAEHLRQAGLEGCVRLVLGMLSDKPVEEFVAKLAPLCSKVYLGSLPGPRGLSAEQLARRIATSGLAFETHADIASAFARAQREANVEEVILVTGSFLSVAAVAELLHE